MSTKALIPGNSQRARSTALNAFERFAVAEGFTVNAIYEFNSVTSYFGNVKNHLLELFPALSAVSGRRLQKIASILDKYCSKRGTDFTHQSPPCTKSDLRSLSLAILKGAVSVQDYQDAALLNILWYLLGRSSDTMCLVKNQPSKNDTPRSPAPRRVEDDELLRRQTLLLEQQAQILGGLAAEVKALNQRVQRLEHPLDVTTAPSTTAAGSLSSSSSALSDTASGVATRAHSRAKPLATVWYEWFLPPLPSARPNRRRYHECKVAVAFMRVFLPAGYNVTGDEVTAKGRILSSGREAEENVLAFLEAENVKAKSHGTIVKVLKRMYAQGKLDDRIRNYQRLQQEGKALEDAPVHVLEPYNNPSTT
ncbi:hypothetical protein PHYSODRAFT_330708 [Phytophthora sojae]|uniref:Uncharacterized protein n=1 Tax=Phytophthora sojae (strain P6497) TaxID=1094619 RepID=G4ZFW3_PHYSP|nr:hypothetical protein PHYSODRAFT_330708 [Phytophthora sojae]EGZ16647.1 hypothetical protein PHYSODRAFT_330708 [Phytophthora sojae]|eukprot:XP_009525705.1 hypothetical protein PHYSODRAFT_330708 [Phytophthora sojae]